MSNPLFILSFSALSVGFVHTLLGPDHYLPFIAIAKAREWSVLKTALITFVCGVGHLLSAIILGFIAVSLSFVLKHLELIESLRGDIAAWVLIGFGLVYLMWGIKHAFKKSHIHHHDHFHEHLDNGFGHRYFKNNSRELAPWVLFVIFVLGPCEPLIPLTIYPAIRGSYLEVAIVSICFGIATLAVMLGLVLTSIFAIKRLRFSFFTRYGHVVAGGIICGSGVMIKFLGS